MTKKYTVKKQPLFKKSFTALFNQTMEHFVISSSRGELIRDLCSVICPGCKNKHTVAKDGWSAIVCLSCKAELYIDDVGGL